MVDALFGDDCEIADGNAVIGHQIIQRVLVVVNDFIRWQAGHDGQDADGARVEERDGRLDGGTRWDRGTMEG